jgi:arylsulfatase
MQKPNILFLFPDQHRGDWMPYGDEILTGLEMEKLPLNMPNIRRLMDEGITFTRTMTPSPLCAPARACLASGTRYGKCNVPDNMHDYPLSCKTFYSILRNGGYSVGGVGKFDLHKKTKWWGVDGWTEDLNILGFTHAIDNEGKLDAVYTEADGYGTALGFVRPEDEPRGAYMKFLKDRGLVSQHISDMKKRVELHDDTSATVIPEDAYCDNFITDNGIKMLHNMSKDKPWFLAVNFTGPHNPWDITSEMKKRWENVKFPLPNSNLKGAEESDMRIRQNYAAMLENIDRNIGRLLNEIDNLGELQNTIIIYTSDHGEMLGDFGKYHKSTFERGSISIPLVIKVPGGKKGIYSDVLVELQDLAATVLDYAGAEMEEAVDSVSLRPVLENKSIAHRQYQISSLIRPDYEWKVVCDSRYKLVNIDDEDMRLYDTMADPWENCNIAGENPDVVDKLLNIAEHG